MVAGISRAPYLAFVPGLFDPSDLRPLFFLGIGGAGMSALALAARRLGIPVAGVDRDDSGFSDLISAGAVVKQMADADDLYDVRAVVTTAAARDDHPVLLAARQAGIPVVPRKVALAELVNGTTLVAIAGTHGKTTTTVMTTEALRGAGLNPSGLAGGRVTTWGGNALLGGREIYVVEADEYDQAFLTLRPAIAVINNVEPDHLECYGSVEAMEAAFVTFAGYADAVFIGTADEGSDRVAATLADDRVVHRVVRFGLERGDGVVAHFTELAADHTHAWIRWPDGVEIELTLRVPGLHNLRNATAAMAVVRQLGGDLMGAAQALGEFAGVGRRFERLGESDGVEFVDDYAHHPTEITAALLAARQAFPGRRLVATFQPHLFSRTIEHGRAMGEALARADVAVVTDIYAAREEPVPGVTGRIVADAAERTGDVEVHYVAGRGELEQEVSGLLRSGDVLMTLGAGDVTLVGRRILAGMVSR